ncbi:MAG: T9SS type A sorting domain-containing protein [Candidatus Cloacimonadia bacterium]
MKKNIVVVFLLILFGVGLFGVTAEAPSKRENENVYEITKLEHLLWIAADSTRWGFDYEQCNDIDASDTRDWENGGWIPIGNETTKFTGSYNGGGYTITGLFINRPEISYQGLFGYIDGGEVSNLVLREVDITASTKIGGLGGQIDNTFVFRCSTTGKIGGNSRVGGLIGEGVKSEINECYSATSLEANPSIAGGLIGRSVECIIKDCYSSGDVIGRTTLGGFLGHYAPGSLDRSYSSGLVNSISDATSVGGFIGTTVGTSLKMSECYWDRDTSNQQTSKGVCYGKLTTSMIEASTFSNWDLDSIWTIVENETYPYLSWQKSIEVGNIPKRALSGESGVYELDTSIGNTPLLIRLQTDESLPTSDIWCQYSTHSDIPGIVAFEDKANYKAYYCFDFEESEHLTRADYFELQFEEEINTVWYRVDKNEWKTTDFIRTDSPLHCKISDIDELSSEARNSYSMIEFIGGTQELQSLPVELSSFTISQIVGQGVILSWTSESETNLLGYNIYRSEDYQLCQAARINNAIIAGHNSSTQKQYTFEDDIVEPEREYFYWLESVDLDLTNEFYGPISIFIENTYEGGETLFSPVKTKLYGAYPNPFNPTTNILFSLEKEASVTIEIYNVNGQKMDTIASNKLYPKGKHSVSWNSETSNKNLSSGIYIVNCSINNKPYRKKIMMLK